MKISVESLNTVSDAYRVARETQGLAVVDGIYLSVDKWRSWLDAEESQGRVFQLRVRFEDVPYWVHVHLVRHKIGIEWFVRTQRPDGFNPVNYDRNEAPQGALIDMTMVCNPQALINVSRKRLCVHASPETRQTWEQVKSALFMHDDPYIAVIADLMLPDCEYRGGYCHQCRPCGKYPRKRP